MEDKKATMAVCECGAQGCNWHWKQHLMKKLLVLAVVLMAFSVGMQIGELKGELRAFRGANHMMMFGGDGFYKSGMMDGRQMNMKTFVSPTDTAPAKTGASPVNQ